MSALTILQRAMLAEDLQSLSAPEWEDCFNKVVSNLPTISDFALMC